MRLQVLVRVTNRVSAVTTIFGCRRCNVFYDYYPVSFLIISILFHLVLLKTRKYTSPLRIVNVLVRPD